MPLSSSPRRPLVRLVAGVLTAGVVCAGGVVLGGSAAQAALPESYIDTASTVWSYSDNDTDPAAGAADRLVWTTSAFDDSAWKTGTGAFGAKNGAATGLGANFPVHTLLTQYLPGTKTDVRTFHFRTDVTVDAADLAEITELDATVTYDDAIQVFVNGTKVAGFVDAKVEAAPEVERNLMYAGDSGGDPVTSSFTIPASALVAGENTISVALYQDRASSSDIYFDFSDLEPVHKDTPAPATTYTDIVQTVGADESGRNVTWYTNTDTAQSLQYAKAGAGSAFPTTGVTTVAATGAETTSGEFNRRAEITGLAENTSYVYRVGSEAAGWSDTFTLTTRAFSGDFDFLFFGDPQIGASGNAQSDGAGWRDTVDLALATYPDAEMLFSGGDQVNTASNEGQYEEYLSPSQVTEVPTVPVNGNHDVGSKAYEQHFTVPNFDPNSGAATSPTASGGDYWFEYKDVLFVVLNSNNRDTASHAAFMEKVVAEHGDEASWKVLAFHHSIYSVAAHTADSDIIQRRAELPQVISDLGFDLVLQGHDHSYTRSYLINGGELADPTEVAGTDTVSAGEGDVLYVTANSASGSKYYDVEDADAWFASVINQEYVRNYTNLEVTSDGITITTLRSQQNGNEKPVNSVVDEVTLVRDDVTAPELTVPADGEVAVGATFDPLAGVSALDDRDGDLTSKITVAGTVDTGAEGVYTLEYAVADAAGNAATATRVVTVVPAAEAPLPTIVAPGSVAQGGVLRVAGSGFGAGEKVGAVVHSDPVDLGAFTANAAGELSIAWTVPADFAPGIHSIALTRASGEVVTAQFTVTAAPVAATPSNPALAVTGGALPVAAAVFGALLLAVGAFAVIRARARRA